MPNTQSNSFKSPGWRMILVLFILLVIATTFVYSSATGNNLRDNDSITTQDSIRFSIYNETVNFPLATASLEGEFEPPFPASHIILPYRSYNFEVLRKYGATNRAYVTYNVLSGTEVVGNIRIFMSVYATSVVKASTEILYINGPISYQNGSRYVTVRNA
ncbi:hypothetical protein [Paenibacillus herberti]|uniref:Uncharacterized protein n=1 Tax=Paenibacillus herberti TaxID=1619309 RepID=A0A229P301_9BACL|nr:hypothetical protein [Paenibacillus herberti]OXM16490.1 hypothetical protein CGZ75_07400 [Paenibacillus herberti]